MNTATHVLINGLSVGGGGGYTVAVQMSRHLADERPDWVVSLLLTEHHPLHEEARRETLPPNCRLQWAPSATRSRAARLAYERATLPRWMRRRRVRALVQLNGTTIPHAGLPTLSHHGDPWPYRPEAWRGLHDRALAFLKRRAHRRSIPCADYTAWTSNYLRDLICAQLRVTPRRDAVLYNGVSDALISRAHAGLTDWTSRPMELITLSNVSEYKRQDLVIRALPSLLRRPGLESLVYRIVGNVDSAPYRERLERLAVELGVSRHVVIEGRVSREIALRHLSTARCFVLMSVCESFGIPALEAMAVGTPVVTADCCAMPEVCGEAAVLSPVDQVEALADRLAEVLTNASLAEDLRRRGIDRIGRFTWRRTAAQAAKILEEIMAADGGP